MGSSGASRHFSSDRTSVIRPPLEIRENSSRAFAISFRLSALLSGAYAAAIFRGRKNHASGKTHPFDTGDYAMADAAVIRQEMAPCSLRDKLLAFLFWLSDGESLIRLPLASSRGFG
jgi:hypothetical protein